VHAVCSRMWPCVGDRVRDPGRTPRDVLPAPSHSCFLFSPCCSLQANAQVLAEARDASPAPAYVANQLQVEYDQLQARIRDLEAQLGASEARAKVAEEENAALRLYICEQVLGDHPGGSSPEARALRAKAGAAEYSREYWRHLAHSRLPILVSDASGVRTHSPWVMTASAGACGGQGHGRGGQTGPQTPGRRDDGDLTDSPPGRLCSAM